MTCVTGHHDIRRYYGDERVSDRYIDRRFSHPLGRLLHQAHVRFVNAVLGGRHVRSVLELAPGPARVTAEVDAPPTAVAMAEVLPTHSST